LLFMTHFSDADIPPVGHRLNEVHRTTSLQYGFRETRPWHAFARTQAYIEFMQAHPVYAFVSPGYYFNNGAKTTAEIGLSASLINMSRGGGHECDEYYHVTVHYMTLYMYSLLE
jgi:hypothetical protein